MIVSRPFCGLQQLSSLTHTMIRNGAVLCIKSGILFQEIAMFLRSKMNGKRLLFIVFGRNTLLQFSRPALRKKGVSFQSNCGAASVGSITR